jgi:hypothetical protein
VLWVHRGGACPDAPQPDLKLRDSNVGQGAGAVITCERCKQRRGMSEAQGRPNGASCSSAVAVIRT